MLRALCRPCEVAKTGSLQVQWAPTVPKCAKTKSPKKLTLLAGVKSVHEHREEHEHGGLSSQQAPGPINAPQFNGDFGPDDTQTFENPCFKSAP